MKILSNQSNRDEFISFFLLFLEDKKYAVLKYVEKSIHDIKPYSDLDILISREYYYELVIFLKRYPQLRKIRIFKKSFMDTIYLFFKDESFLEIDLIYEFVRKDLVYLNSEEVLSTSNFNSERIKVPYAVDHVLYIFLFYLLNNSSIDSKYYSFINNLSSKNKGELIMLLKKTYFLKINNIQELFEFNESTYEKVYNSIVKLNSKKSRIRNLYNYISDIKTNFNKSKEFLIVHNSDENSKNIFEFKKVLTEKYRNNVAVIEYKGNISYSTNRVSKFWNKITTITFNLKNELSKLKLKLNGVIILHNYNLTGRGFLSKNQLVNTRDGLLLGKGICVFIENSNFLLKELDSSKLAEDNKIYLIKHNNIESELEKVYVNEV